MNYTKNILLIFVVLSSLTFVSASTCPVGIAYCNENIPFVNTAPSTGQTVDNTTFYSNNSQYLQGLTPQQVANLYNENDTLQTVTNRGSTTTNNITISSTNSQLTVNRNTQPLGAGALSGTGVRLNCADNEQCRYGITSYGIAGMSGFSARSARGTGASPTASQANDVLGQFDAYGRSTSAWAVTPKGMIKIIAVDNYTDTSQGTKLEFWTTPSGTVVPVRSMIINEGNITMYANLTSNYLCNSTGSCFTLTELNTSSIINPFDQVLNTTSNVSFNTLNLSYKSASIAGTGTITDDGYGAITGVGTKFLNEINVGDSIMNDDTGLLYGVIQITSNTSLNLNAPSGAIGSNFHIIHASFRVNGSSSLDGGLITTDGSGTITTNGGVKANTISFAYLNSALAPGYLIYDTLNNPSSFGPSNSQNPYVTDLGSSDLGTEWNNLYLTGNASIGQLIKLSRITLSTCNTAINGSIGRNATGIYYCNGTVWNNLLLSNYVGSVDTLQTVTDRGNFTSNGISVAGVSAFYDNVSINPNSTTNYRMTVNNCTWGSNNDPSATLQVCRSGSPKIRLSSPNSNNYLDLISDSSSGKGTFTMGWNIFDFILQGSSARGFRLTSPASEVIKMQGTYSSASGNGVKLILSGGGEPNIYYGGGLDIQGGNSTNTSRIGLVRIVDGYTGSPFMTIDSIKDLINFTIPINFTSISNFVNTSYFLDNMSTGNISPTTTNVSSIGSSALKYLKGWFSFIEVDNLNVTNNAVIYNLTTTDGAIIGGNLHVSGNFSAKRPYWNGYYNGTDNFLSTAAVQKMNLSNNPDYDGYLISINETQAIKFQLTGDYLCIISPEFTNTAATAQVAFWMRKNGVDVPWSNSRYSISNGEYLAPAIPFQFDITNTTTDYIEFYWYSTSTNSKLESISGLTAPTRPSVPAVIVNCNKISEITE